MCFQILFSMWVTLFFVSVVHRGRISLDHFWFQQDWLRFIFCGWKCQALSRFTFLHAYWCGSLWQGQHLASGYSNSQGIYSSVLTKVTILCNWLGACWARYQRSPFYVQVNKKSIPLILMILFTVIILGKQICT